MHDYKKLAEAALEARTAIWNAAQDIIDKAASENRNLSGEERAALDKMNADMDAKASEARELVASAKREDEIRSLGDPAGLYTRSETRNAAGEWLAGELRGLVGTGSTNGGAFTPSATPAIFFDRLAASSVLLRSGVRVVRTDRDSVIIPRLTADTTADFVAEAGTISSTDATADQITATPRKLAALQALTNELIGESSPDVLDVVAMGMIRSIALKADLAFFEGSGTAPAIRGLKNVVGISEVSMGTNGAALTNLDPFADAIGTLEADNAEGSVIVMHPRTWKAAIKLKETTSSTKPLLQESAGSGSAGVKRSIYGLPVLLSSQLSITETQGTSSVASSAYVYAAEQVVAVLREDAKVEKDSSRLFNSDQSEVRVLMRADLAVPNPKAVCRILGILA